MSHAAIQRDVIRLEKCAGKYLMEFSNGPPSWKAALQERAWVFLVDTKLNRSQKHAFDAKKTNGIFCYIRQSKTSR